MTAPTRAAGAVIFRRSDKGIRLLVLRAYKNWDFPKGTIEPGEDALAAARRAAEQLHTEVLLETFHLVADRGLRDVQLDRRFLERQMACGGFEHA